MNQRGFHMLFSRVLILCILVCGTTIVSGQPKGSTRSVVGTSDGPPAYHHTSPDPPVVAPVPTRPIIVMPPGPLSWLHIDPDCHRGNTQPPGKVLSKRS